MSLSQIRNVVLLFSNPIWSGSNTVPTTIVRNVTALAEDYAWQDTMTQNLTTLTSRNADTANGIIQGFLYVPDIEPTTHECFELEKPYLGGNVTRQQDLPPAKYNLIAIAPWFNTTCTQLYLRSARIDPIRAFIFYKPNNSTSKPQDGDKPVWDLNDGGKWKEENHFPIFAVPSSYGSVMMEKLREYQGPIESVPHGDEIMEQFGPSPKDYVKIWTALTIEPSDAGVGMWAYFLVVLGALIFIIVGVSVLMHWVQSRRRKSLIRRVENGDVDLEAMGIKRVTVPKDSVLEFKVWTYVDLRKMARQNRESSWRNGSSNSSPPPTPRSPTVPRSVRSRASRRSTGTDVPPGSVRSVGRSTTGSVNTTATNKQPRCHICLENFRHRSSIIRQLPCGHIFHIDCIDEFLMANSSLCPKCKQCMLPRGYCPEITNAMVRRERAIRHIQPVHTEEVDEADEDPKADNRRPWVKRFFSSTPSHDPLQNDVPLTPIKSLKTEHEASTAPLDSVTVASTTPDPLATTATTPSPPEILATPDTEISSSQNAPENGGSQPPDASKPSETPISTAPEAQPTTAPDSSSVPSEVTQTPVIAQPTPPKARRKKTPQALPLNSVPEDLSLPANGASAGAPVASSGATAPNALHPDPGRKPPSALARRRMQFLAEPFYDPDQNAPKWKRAINKVFPGFT